MKYLNILFLLGVIMLAFSLDLLAKTAPSEMKVFNQACPAPKLCSIVTRLHARCIKNKKDCDLFVYEFAKLLPEYDCQRSFDVTPKEKYIVPALWMCSNREELLDFISRLQTPNSRRLFGSGKLRAALMGAGHLEETYTPLSLAASEVLKKKSQ